ncbi:MAG: hypothetical protein WCH20_10695 [Nitrospira sp.]
MKVAEFRPQNLNIVLLYDPVDVKKLPLDPIKTSTKFDLITLFPNDIMGGVLALASDPLKAKITIQSNRLEYINEQHDTPFQERRLDELWAVLKSMQSFTVQSLGINFFILITPEHDKGSGGFIAEHYINNSVVLEKTLGQPILSASARFLLGTQEHYRDIRLTPVEIGSKSFLFQYHLHQDVRIAETEKLIQTITQAFDTSWKECQEWLTKLP